MRNQIPSFTPENASLVLIDHQTGTMQLIKNMPLNVVKRNALALAKVAKILNMPIVLTSSQEEMFQGPLLPELAQIVPEAFGSPHQADRNRECLGRQELCCSRGEDRPEEPRHGGCDD
jgi:hypothetical protein